MNGKKIMEMKDGNIREFTDFSMSSNEIRVNDIACFADIFPEYSQASANAYNNMRLAATSIVTTATSRRLNNKLLAEDYMIMLEEAKTREDLDKIYNLLVNAYVRYNSLKTQKTKYTLSKSDKIYEKYPDVAMSILSLKIAVSYFTQKCNEMTQEQVAYLEEAKRSGVDMLTLLEMTGEHMTENAKENGFAALCGKVFSDCLYERSFKSKLDNGLELHLCMSCDNARANRCLKVATRKKLEINKYDFITEGYQVYTPEGELDKFVVSKCDNYVEDIPRIFNLEDNDSVDTEVDEHENVLEKYRAIVEACDMPVRVRKN